MKSRKVKNVAQSAIHAVLQFEEPSLDLAIQTFLQFGLAGKAASTRLWYRRRLEYFAAWVGRDRPIGQVLDVDLLSWSAELEQRATKWGGGSTHPEAEGKLSAHYRHSLIRAVRSFFTWLHTRQVIEVNPVDALELPRLPKTGRKGIADADVQRILDLAKTGLGDGYQERDEALLRFLECTGSRRGGIVNLRLEDLNLNSSDEKLRRQAVVREKGEKERAVFLTPAATDAMERWLAVRPAVADDHVFLGRSNGGAWHALTESGVFGVLRRYAKAAGVTKNWGPHQWRHRFGRLMAQRGVNLGLVAQMMGHMDVSITVNFYGIFAVSELQDVHDARWPQAA